LPANRGPVAQLGARFHGMEEVVGSIPTRSTKFNRQLIEGFWLSRNRSMTEGLAPTSPFTRA
jgi:hypothetical protein